MVFPKAHKFIEKFSFCTDLFAMKDFFFCRGKWIKILMLPQECLRPRSRTVNHSKPFFSPQDELTHLAKPKYVEIGKTNRDKNFCLNCFYKGWLSRKSLPDICEFLSLHLRHTKRHILYFRRRYKWHFFLFFSFFLSDISYQDLGDHSS